MFLDTWREANIEAYDNLSQTKTAEIVRPLVKEGKAEVEYAVTGKE